MIPVQGRLEEAGEEAADGLVEGAFGTVLNVLQTFREQVGGGGAWLRSLSAHRH